MGFGDIYEFSILSTCFLDKGIITLYIHYLLLDELGDFYFIILRMMYQFCTIVEIFDLQIFYS